MEEEKKKPVEAVKDEEVVKEDEEEILDPDDFEDEGDDDTEPSEEEPSESANEEVDKEKEKNAKAAERRRRREKAEKERAEREAKIREDATLKAELGILKVNPYTDEPIEDAEDLKIYKIQKELDDEGKDPVNDLPKRLAENARKAAKEAKEREESEQRAKQDIDNKVKQEIEEFRKKYPNVNLPELAKDKLFLECLNGRAGRWTQVEIYELYLNRKAQEAQKAEEEAKKELVEKGAKKLSNPPSATSAGSSPQKTLEEMSKEEFEAYFQKKYKC